MERVTSDSNRLHIAFLGERNSGKSSLLNAITGQNSAIVSDVPGTTTDHVSKAMELPGIGACTFMDTAGIDDLGKLGAQRVSDTFNALRGADIIIIVVDAMTGRLPVPEISVGAGIPDGAAVTVVLNKSETVDEGQRNKLLDVIRHAYGRNAIIASALNATGIKDILNELQRIVPKDWEALPITAGAVKDGDLVVLVMPQDKEAPKGRLILPQQQTIRELLERKCRIACCTTDCLEKTLNSLNDSPDVIITDAQAYAEVIKLKPEGTALTSFSALLAASKGDIGYFTESAAVIGSLNGNSRVLIAEACTHVPDTEDIGRVKIPSMLRKIAGEGIVTETVSGRDFPSDLSAYDLVIHCGACMFNRRYVMSRVEQAKRQGVAMTNYGVAIRYMTDKLLFNNND